MERGRHEHYEPGEGCLTRLVRIPVRIVVLVVVVPLRMIWDVLAACGRALNRTVLAPVGRGIAWLATRVADATLWLGKALFVWPWVALWRYVLAPAGRGIAVAVTFLARYLVIVPLSFLVRYLVIVPVTFLVRYLIVVPAVWLYAHVLTPLGHGLRWLARALGAAVAFLVRYLLVVPVTFLVRYLLVVPAKWLYAYVLTPLGRAVAWLVRGIGAAVAWLARGVATVVAALVRWILVVPAVALWRHVLLPVGRALAAAVTVVVREITEALGHCWRAAGFVSRAVGRFLGRLLRWTVVEPCRWAYRTVLTPLGHGLRDGIWRPVRHILRETGRATRRALTAARESARQTRKELRRALFGAPEKPAPAAVPPPRREPGATAARTLGKTSGRDLPPPTQG
ncbi:hypothetical protein FCH28_10910 [Streptomyces piniterrae]|uniref:Uncharacterized protein n=1 Tax=Streptomyces piniterrae TaxID=2571125 RepID=A0A4U0NPI1_9ACTN|nr:hypothetical protein [Streptomyces piniterrae]TJZ55802.1 hypothetical protein FCH28_10910 [Streptomyces piniterrae]